MNEAAQTPKEGLTQHARRGAVATFGRQGAQSLVQLGTSIALARLLVPEEFGVAALATAFSALPQALGDLGLGTYVIQASEVPKSLLRRILGLGYLVGVALAAVQISLAPLAAAFYGDSRVSGVLMVLAIGFPVQALWKIHENVLRRELRFAASAGLNMLQVALSAAGSVVMAAAGYSYWSLVWPPVLSSLFIAPAYWYFSRLSPWPSLCRGAAELPKGLLSFSGFTSGNALIGYIVNNADYLLVGRLLQAEALGLYTFAYTKAYALSKRVLAGASAVALPVYAAAKEDAERLRRGFYKGLTIMLTINVPLAIFAAGAAPELIPLLFGERWLTAVVPFQILSLHVAVNAVTSPVDSATYAIGRPDIAFKVAMLMVPILLAGYYIGAQTAGIVGVAIAVTTVKSFASLVKVSVVLRILGWKQKEFLKNVLPTFFIALVAAAASRYCTAPVREESMKLLSFTSLFAFLLLSASYIFDREKILVIKNVIFTSNSMK